MLEKICNKKGLQLEKGLGPRIPFLIFLKYDNYL